MTNFKSKFVNDLKIKIIDHNEYNLNIKSPDQQKFFPKEVMSILSPENRQKLSFLTNSHMTNIKILFVIIGRGKKLNFALYGIKN